MKAIDLALECGRHGWRKVMPREFYGVTLWLNKNGWHLPADRYDYMRPMRYYRTAYGAAMAARARGLR